LSILNRLQKKGLDVSKETHPSKPYYVHVNECYKFVDKMMKEVYRFSEDIVEFALAFSELHDVGKLLQEWSLNQKKRPYHAIEGAEWLLTEGRDILTDIPYNEILFYAIMTHHSSLHVPAEAIRAVNEAEKIKQRRFKNYFQCKAHLNKLNSIIRNLKRGIRFDLVDAIGIAKLADIISAKNLPLNRILMQYEHNHWYEEFEDKLIEGVSKRAYEKRGLFDQIKFERQVEIASSQARHLLVAAPTGWGKTTLALIRISKLKPVKIFYVLPTITAIKDFYDTFTKIVDETYVGEYFYFADVDLLTRHETEEDSLLDIYRYFIPRITITTIDQLLLTILQVGRYHIRRFNFRDSLIILDEFHLLTPQMISSLRFFLKNLSQHYNASILFMSATPSFVYSDALKEALPQLGTTVLSDEYRRLKRHKIELYSGKIENLLLEKQDLLNKHRILIIVNTVRTAQRIYKDLKERLRGLRNVVLVHGDFAYKDRAKKEAEISNADVLISTQVAEVSLDISFDVLMTELSPIPSLVQRLGRVNRYGGKPSETNAIVSEPEGYQPYGEILIKIARENIPILLENLEKRGEEAYLDKEFWRYEELYREEIESIEEKARRIIEENMFDFFSLTISEKELLEMLGREETYLAVPEIYLEKMLTLHKRLQELRNMKNYEERLKIYAQIKNYLVPVSRSDLRKAEWHEELRSWVIANYEEDLGIVRN
jgi:CRISPR-associated endonuclease/helicase Cas3